MNVDTHSKSSSFGDLKPHTIAGLVLVPLGVWAALEPFLFGGWTWDWHLGRFLLAVLPGGIAAVGGLVMLAGNRRAVQLGGGLALTGGLAFVAGPPLYAAMASNELGTLSGGESVRMLQWMPFFFGVGALVSLVSAYGLGLISPMRFAEDALPEPATAPGRVRVPLPPERARRQRGVKEPGERRERPETDTKRSTRET